MRRSLQTGLAAVAMLLLPTAVTDAQLPPPQPADCARVAPVCALKNGSKQTYWNTCLAARDTAELLYAGECRIPRSYGMNRKSPAFTRI
jgi:hypothetical protein